MWPNLQETVDLVAFTEEIVNGNFHFLRSDFLLFLNIKMYWNPIYVAVYNI